MGELSTRERMQIPRQEMPERDPRERSRTFDEVNLGFTAELARLEASRCIACRRPPCVAGCPVDVRIDEFVTLVAEGDFKGAAAVITRDNSLPAICGRVCPQEEQCEGACVLGRKHRPVAIGHLERFVADHMGEAEPPPATRMTAPGRVAIVGSGPAGLSCAADLARAGHRVTVFEALHELGGVLVYGIPEYRLPKAVVKAEIRRLEALGVEFVTNAVIGMSATLDDLLGEFDAVFLGVGAGLPRFPGIPGEDLIGVYSANEFLTRVNLMKAYLPAAETPVYDVAGRRVGVFGGGNTAMDAVRTALRMGAAEAVLFYRRTEEEMPARDEEITHARAEGVRFATLVSPLAFTGDERGWLRGVTLAEMELGEPDESGRRRPRPVPSRERHEPIDVAVIAIGNAPNPSIRRSAPDLDHHPDGTVVADPATGKTSKQGVFAGGDIVTGGATVILAMGAGRRAARAIHAYLGAGVW